ncbi:MAG: hypothetical protein CW338_09725 [Clostridiales bacterium]|nr:hypothetical protein [Clostridiales bacterium]
MIDVTANIAPGKTEKRSLFRVTVSPEAHIINASGRIGREKDVLKQIYQNLQNTADTERK